MAVGDFLSSIGQGLEKGAAATGKVAGALAPAIGKAVVNEEAGYAPQIAAEGRQHTQAMEDQQINAKEQELTAQLNMGRQYGTLNPQQQQQYVDAITNLYSHPRHAGTLMEKLRQAVHPNGMTAGSGQQAAPALANATPAGGTAAVDERHKEEVARQAADLRNEGAQELADERARLTSLYHKPAGKSPPLPGSQLPPDAIGADGQPISAQARNAGNSYVEWNGSWWPVAKAKPVFKTVKGHSVLVDAQSGNILRDLGPTGSAKVTTRQTLQPGDDGQMHMVSLTSVSAPGGETIEVQPEQQGESGEGQQSTPNKPSEPSAPTPTSPKPKSSVASSLGGTKTLTRPINPPSGGASPGKVVPGLSTLARSKNPLYHSDVTQYTKVAEEANSKNEAYQAAQKALAGGSTPSSDQELVYSWVRANVQGAGRMTQAEFQQAGKIGGLPQRAQNAFTLATKGKLPPQMEQMLLADIKRSAETSQQEADSLRQRLNTSQGGASGGGGGHQVGETKKFPNGKTGIWDGQGWVAQ